MAPQIPSGPPPRPTALGSRTSRLVAGFLRLVLVPTLLVGLPAWPLLVLLSLVPLVNIIALPLLAVLTLTLFYSIPWLTYLIMAQADPPSSSESDTSARAYLPFLPFSASRCLNVNIAAAQYVSTIVSQFLPALMDWCYKRVMMLGTQGGNGIIKENIWYGSPYSKRRLDVYMPLNFALGAPKSAQSATHKRNGSSSVFTTAAGGTVRHRKHSTLFADVPDLDAAQAAASGDSSTPANTNSLAPVVVFLPSPVPPFSWTVNRIAYLQLALRLRKMGFCVVIPDITYYPESRIASSITDLRLVLRWVGENCQSYGGDPRKIHLMGHGLSAHLALLTIVQEAVVLSREGHLELIKAEERGTYGYEDGSRHHLQRWDAQDEEIEEMKRQGDSDVAASAEPERREASSDNDAWVDEPSDIDTAFSRSRNRRRSGRGAPVSTSRGGASGDAGGFAFPSTADKDSFAALDEQTMRETQRVEAQVNRMSTAPEGLGEASDEYDEEERYYRSSGGDTTASITARLEAGGNNPASRRATVARADPLPTISNGLRRVRIVAPEIELPPIAGLILLSGVSDVIKGFRSESERGVEHLSYLRRAMGPSHTSCLLNSPAHLLFAAKNVLDTQLLPPKFLFVHGGADSVVPIAHSTLTKTLLTGSGVEHVTLRAYRQLGHAEAISALFIGPGRSKSRYAKQILDDVHHFVTS